jgi:hypothetical protein
VISEKPIGVNRTSKSWSLAARDNWRKERRALIGAVRTWASTSEGSTFLSSEAQAVLAALAAMDAAAREATAAKRAVRKGKVQA